MSFCESSEKLLFDILDSMQEQLLVILLRKNYSEPFWKTPTKTSMNKRIFFTLGVYRVQLNFYSSDIL